MKSYRSPTNAILPQKLLLNHSPTDCGSPPERKRRTQAVRIRPCNISHSSIQNKKSSIHKDAALGAAGGIRTSGLWSRSPTLYPAELRPHIYENRRWDEIHRIKL